MTGNTILCYGDSNTYGYDPRDPFGGRYDPDSRWCDLLSKSLNSPVINCGENGRVIPANEWSYQILLKSIRREHPAMLLLLLGTNDLLIGRNSPEEIAERMETLLGQLRRDFPALTILLLSPPQISLPVVSAEPLSVLYKQIADRLEIDFLDSFRWNTPLAFDGVHFSEAGHHAFAANLFPELKKRLPL